MKNLKEAAERIKKADKHIIYSDSDLDGITSALIMKKSLEELGYNPSCFFTNKEERGYGLSPDSVDLFRNEAPALLIVMDCGISNFEGVKKTKEAGFEIILLDHHKPHDKLPRADLIVCPKLTGDTFKERPNAGIILELSKILLSEEKKEFLEYTALAIFGDMMPHRDKNAEVLSKSEKNFPATSGVEVFQGLLDSEKPLELYQKIASFLNVTKMISQVPESFLYFQLKEKKDQKIMAEKLMEQYESRKERVREIKKKVLEAHKEGSIVFEGSVDYQTFLLGKVASKIVKKLDKPVFIYKEKGGVSQGTVRVPEGEDAVEAMKVSEDILLNYGGHPPAAGFTIKTENLKKFKNNLIKYFQ